MSGGSIGLFKYLRPVTETKIGKLGGVPTKKVLIGFIWFYRAFLSPLKPPTCRFIPTCSEYAILAIEKYGAYRGGILAVKRILKCHPFHPGGYDPI